MGHAILVESQAVPSVMLQKSTSERLVGQPGYSLFRHPSGHTRRLR